MLGLKLNRWSSTLYGIALFSLFAAPALSFAHTAEDPLRTDLLIGRGDPATERKIGEFQVWNDTQSIYAKFLVSAYGGSATPGDNWCLSDARVHVSPDLDFPPPDEYAYHATLTCQLEHTFVIPKSWGVDTLLYLAAQAEVIHLGGREAFEAFLPQDAVMTVKHRLEGAPAYFEVKVSQDTFANGTHDGWCIDTRRKILDDVPYPVTMYSSYATLPAGAVDRPENLPQVNWIINQDFPGQVSPGGFGVYTFGDVQRAIWSLIDNSNADPVHSPWDHRRVNEIVVAALASGQGFVPSCEQKIGIVLLPKNTEIPAQTVIAGKTLIDLGIPCQSEMVRTSIGNELECTKKSCPVGVYVEYVVQ